MAAQHDHRWNVRKVYEDGSTSYLPLNAYKRAARMEAMNVVNGEDRYDTPRLVAAVVVDGWEVIEPSLRDCLLTPDAARLLGASAVIDVPVFAAVEAVGAFLRHFGAPCTCGVDCFDCGARAGHVCKPEYGCTDAARAMGHRADATVRCETCGEHADTVTPCAPCHATAALGYDPDLPYDAETQRIKREREGLTVEQDALRNGTAVYIVRHANGAYGDDVYATPAEADAAARFRRDDVVKVCWDGVTGTWVELSDNEDAPAIDPAYDDRGITRETAELVASLACEGVELDIVTAKEAAAVVAWCREWVADTYADASDEAGGYAADYLLRRCDSLIDGGLAFVLADVRRVARAEADHARDGVVIDEHTNARLRFLAEQDADRDETCQRCGSLFDDIEEDRCHCTGSLPVERGAFGDKVDAAAARNAIDAMDAWSGSGDIDEDCRVVRDILSDLPAVYVALFFAKVARTKFTFLPQHGSNILDRLAREDAVRSTDPFDKLREEDGRRSAFTGDQAAQLILGILQDRGYDDAEQRMEEYDGDFGYDFVGPMIDRVADALYGDDE